MRTTKRIILPILLSLALILSACPAVALADSSGSSHIENEVSESFNVDGPDIIDEESSEGYSQIYDNISRSVWWTLCAAFAALFTVFFILFRKYKKEIEQSS